MSADIWAPAACPSGWRPVGRTEIAELLAVGVGTVDEWAGRRKVVVGFPDPTWSIGGRDVWAEGAVLDWAANRVDPRTRRARAKAVDA